MNVLVFVQVWVPSPTHSLSKNCYELCSHAVPSIVAKVLTQSGKGLEVKPMNVRVAMPKLDQEATNLAGEMALVISHNLRLSDQTRHALETEVPAELGSWLESKGIYTKPTVFVH